MPLSSLPIVNLVQSQTENSIKPLDYALLKSWVLERKPIDSVVSSVIGEIEIHYRLDNEQMTRQVTQDFCDFQKRSDINQEKEDVLEQEQDRRLEISLKDEITSLESTISHKNRERMPIQRDLEDYRREMDSKNRDLTFARSALTSTQTEIIAIERRNNEIRIAIQDANQYSALEETHNEHFHGHPHHPRHDHVHTQPHYSSDGHLPDFGHLIFLRAQESMQQSTVHSLEGQLQAAEQRHRETESTLTVISKDLEKLHHNCTVKTKQLYEALPEKQRIRDRKASERRSREHARTLAYDPNFEQLSAENRSKFHQKRNEEGQRLDQLKSTLQSQVVNISHPTYLDELKKQLAAHTLNLTETEYSTLKQLITLFNEYLLLEKTQRNLKLELTQKQQQLPQLLSELQTNKRQLDRTPEIIEQLSQNNQILSFFNNDLEMSIETSHRRAKKAYISSAVLLVLGGINLGLNFLYQLDLPFHAIPASLGTGGLGALTAGVINTRRARAETRQFHATQEVITRQTARMTTQNAQADHLKLQIIPEQEKNLARLQADLATNYQTLHCHEERMQGSWQFLKSMEAQTPSNPSNFAGNDSSFFPSESPQPSAPPFIKPPSYDSIMTASLS